MLFIFGMLMGNMDTANMKWTTGMLVRFRHPEDETEAALKLVVIEDNGNRVKVQWAEPLTENSRIRPIAVYAKEDLCAC